MEDRAIVASLMNQVQRLLRSAFFIFLPWLIMTIWFMAPLRDASSKEIFYRNYYPNVGVTENEPLRDYRYYEIKPKKKETWTLIIPDCSLLMDSYDKAEYAK